MYDERMVAPMRQELTRLGVEETRTAQDVDNVLGEKKGTVLVVVNSVCGCAAGMARPAVAMALEHDEPPGADYCVITFVDPTHKPIEIPKPLGAGESQELDEIRRALQYRFPT